MWQIADTVLHSRLLLGTAQYPSPDIMAQAIKAAKVDFVTVSLRRQNPKDNAGQAFWQYIQQFDVHVLPNTAGCHTVKEAVTLAHMARERFDTHWIKLEIIGDDYTLQPDPIILLEATRILIADGFEVFPYCTEDLIIAQKLVALGCKVIMPWGAPIGSGRGLLNPYALKTLRSRLPDTILILDAGIGKPSEAIQIMEMGFDAVLLNTAIALAGNPVQMAAAFAEAIQAGYKAYHAGPMTPRETASPSTPTLGIPFWQQKDMHDHDDKHGACG